MSPHNNSGHKGGGGGEVKNTQTGRVLEFASVRDEGIKTMINSSTSKAGQSQDKSE